MHGNVWQWCQDSFSTDPTYEVADPQGSYAQDSDRVLRGGSLSSNPLYCTAAIRNLSHPANRYNNGIDVGFRVVVPMAKTP